MEVMGGENNLSGLLGHDIWKYTIPLLFPIKLQSIIVPMWSVQLVAV